jgi:cell division protein FtsB
VCVRWEAHVCLAATHCDDHGCGAGGLLFVHVMFGANGMIVYKQKRAEYESLQKRIAGAEGKRALYAADSGIAEDEKAIEKEAREQLHYARPGEYVYVPPTPANPAPPAITRREKGSQGSRLRSFTGQESLSS